MKRVHIHVGVSNLEQAINFYNNLFGAAPCKTKPDYAKWLLDDPQLNFAISTRTKTLGVDHLGIQMEEESELQEARERMAAAELETRDQGETVCCYARSEKSWSTDPAGVAWETFITMQDAEVFSTEQQDSACCAPAINPSSKCC